MQIPIYVISLLDATERRKSIQNQLAKLNLEYEIVDAIDGRLPNFSSIYDKYIDEEWYKKRNGEPLTLSEKACALSHATIYNHLIMHNITEAIVLEDDAVLMEDFYEYAMKKFPLEAYQQLTILHVYKQQYATKVRININRKYSLYKPYRKFLGACAYYLSISDAKALYEASLPIWSTSDWPLKIENDLLARGVEPPLVQQSESLDSQIQRFKNRKTPMHVTAARLSIIPNLIYPSYFGSIWKSYYAWQAVIKRVSNKFTPVVLTMKFIR
ncbi:glycosyltransferase family 25 protein [Cobetia crustatorum]|uniref:glycosyltransferase family 25 protein n=1 Tax=Cobetia crustatorum TaxID=553385 RepID=UPI000A0094E3|nr:glycosyltransferase family 25 protein [Cobetia crustatorum]